MDNSTAGVTLLSGFIFDVLWEYEDMRDACRPAFEMAAGLADNDPGQWVDMDTYNNICNWIEQNIGVASVEDAGRSIGRRVIEHMLEQGVVDANPSPLQIMQGLKGAADVMIRDPKGRGWELRDIEAESLVMRRTQTFNCKLQTGLLESLLERADVKWSRVQHVRCEREGAEFCDYKLTWR